MRQVPRLRKVCLTFPRYQAEVLSDSITSTRRADWIIIPHQTRWLRFKEWLNRVLGFLQLCINPPVQLWISYIHFIKLKWSQSHSFKWYIWLGDSTDYRDYFGKVLNNLSDCCKHKTTVITLCAQLFPRCAQFDKPFFIYACTLKSMDYVHCFINEEPSLQFYSLLSAQVAVLPIIIFVITLSDTMADYCIEDVT